MTSATFARPEKFQIGRVLNNCFAVIGRNIVLTGGIAVLFAGVPAALFQLWTQSRLQEALQSDPGAAADPSFAFRNSGFSIIGFFILAMFGVLVKAALVRATIEDLNGKRPKIGDCLQIAIRFLLPALAVGFLVTLASSLAMIALIVPGVILWLGWCVSVPVLIQEKLGVTASMARSRALTKGSRWELFGLFLIVIILASVIQGSATVLVVLLHGIAATIVAGLLQSITSLLISVAVAVSYVELRQVKEGTSVDELADIFS